jgi:hypothetical protein
MKRLDFWLRLAPAEPDRSLLLFNDFAPGVCCHVATSHPMWVTRHQLGARLLPPFQATLEDQVMDGTAFDHLIKRLAATHLTRARAIHGLAASATLAGGYLAADDAVAGRKKKVRICVCADAAPASCKTQKKKKAKARKTLASNACAYPGRCSGVSGCAVPPVCEGKPDFTPCGDDGLGCVGGQCVETCGAAVSAGPPERATFSVQDDEGLVSIVVTRSENADTVVPPFIPGTTDPVSVTSIKIDQSQPARITMQVTDAASNERTCDVTF